MDQIHVYDRYFAAEGEIAGVPRRGARVMLIAESGGGHIAYDAAVTFFPHRDEEDFAVTYDAYAARRIYDAPGRRSKKREAQLLAQLPEQIDRLAAEQGARVDWDRPLRPARRG